jgi:ElaA protein
MTTWQWSSFNELSRDDLYEILRVRQEVFTVEQNCAYQDADGFDQCARHLLQWHHSSGQRQLAAYLRVLPPASRFQEPSIGRLLTVQPFRGKGLARIIMLEALARITALYPGMSIRISAQQYLEHFYNSLGFTTASGSYDEDGIPHREMLMSPHSRDISGENTLLQGHPSQQTA